MQFVSRRRHASHHASARVARQEELDFSVSVEGMSLAVDQFSDVTSKWRHPERIVTIEPVRQLDERPPVSRGADRLDVQWLSGRVGETGREADGS